MTEHQHATAVLQQWVWATFFCGFGLYLLWRPDFLTRNSMKGVCSAVGPDKQRLKDALSRRESIERISRGSGYAAGVASLLIGVLDALRAAPAGLLYALFCTFLSLMMATVYWQLRNGQRRRVAVLQARSSMDVIPFWLMTLAALEPAMLLTHFTNPALRVPAVIVMISSAISLIAAGRLTALPAVLEGVDLNAEIALDRRVRLSRSAGALILSAAQPFVLCSQALGESSAAQTVAYFVTLAIFLTVMIWSSRNILGPISIAA